MASSIKRQKFAYANFCKAKFHISPEHYTTSIERIYLK